MIAALPLHLVPVSSVVIAVMVRHKSSRLAMMMIAMLTFKYIGRLAMDSDDVIYSRFAFKR